MEAAVLSLTLGQKLEGNVLGSLARKARRRLWFFFYFLAVFLILTEHPCLEAIYEDVNGTKKHLDTLGMDSSSPQCLTPSFCHKSQGKPRLVAQ